MLAIARPRLDGLAESVGVPGPLHITHRAKTTQTIIEKLRREHRMSLARMQDIAGIRVVAPVTFDDQSRLAEEVARCFPPDPRPPSIVDRHENPSHGYRAVHVVVCLDGVTIEVQIRTVLQHLWADITERIADRLGRQIRYGEPPTPPEGISQEVADMIVQALRSLSDGWADKTFAPASQDFSLEDFVREMRDEFFKAMPEGIDL